MTWLIYRDNFEASCPWLRSIKESQRRNMNMQNEILFYTYGPHTETPSCRLTCLVPEVSGYVDPILGLRRRMLVTFETVNEGWTYWVKWVDKSFYPYYYVCLLQQHPYFTLQIIYGSYRGPSLHLCILSTDQRVFLRAYSHSGDNVWTLLKRPSLLPLVLPL